MTGSTIIWCSSEANFHMGIAGTAPTLQLCPKHQLAHYTVQKLCLACVKELTLSLMGFKSHCVVRSRIGLYAAVKNLAFSYRSYTHSQPNTEKYNQLQETLGKSISEMFIEVEL